MNDFQNIENSIINSAAFSSSCDITGHALAGTYQYEGSKPHAVTSVTPTADYPDAISDVQCETEYNFLNQPMRIAEGNVEILLEYGADGQRTKAEFKTNGHVVRTHYYISANYEKEIDSRGAVTHYHYIYGANGLAAVCMRRGSTDKLFYVHPDRLGSYTHVTDENKQVLRALHFDPWGNVKTDTNWTVFAENALSSLYLSYRFDRGFTGHEHYADLKVINMNGRLYDPVIARFFSPDNFVQVPDFTQSYNRYSYCLNNPLQYVDPSGEFAWSFNDWYIDSKRNIQWFESKSETIEINGQTYTRIGSTVLLFSINGQKIFGDEHGSIHYMNPLKEVVIHGAKQQNLSSSEIDIGLSYSQNSLIISSTIFSVAGLRLGKSISTFRITNSKGDIDFHYYKNGWTQNQYVKTQPVAEYGKYFNRMGKILGWIDVEHNVTQIFSTNDLKKKITYGFDASVDFIGMYGGIYGLAFSLYYSEIIKNYSQIQRNVNKQYEERADMMMRGYIPIGTPGFPFK